MGNGTKHVQHVLYRLEKVSTRVEKNRRYASLVPTIAPSTDSNKYDDVNITWWHDPRPAGTRLKTDEKNFSRF